MTHSLYDDTAPRRTVSLTLNSDLYGLAKEAGINVSRVAEQALAATYADHVREALRIQMAADLAALDRLAETHGSFTEEMEAWEAPDNEPV
jgi:post-segregation antitoxin (ccd killing protein)